MLTRVFLEHPRSVDESYLEHLMFAMRFAFTLFGAATAALVHALIPCLFEKTASGIIATLYERTRGRGADAAAQPSDLSFAARSVSETETASG